MQSSVESGIPLRHVHKTAKTIRKKLGNANASFDIRSLVWDSCGGIRKRTSIWTGPLSTQAKNREDGARRSEWRSYPWLVNLCIGSCTKESLMMSANFSRHPLANTGDFPRPQSRRECCQKCFPYRLKCSAESAITLLWPPICMSAAKIKRKGW